MHTKPPVVIVGTGLSGYTLAREIRKQDSEIPLLLITADDGVSYSKPMLSTGFTKGKAAPELAQADAATMVEQLDIELRTHTRVTTIDPAAHQIHLGDEVVDYHKLVLAWGADVVRLDLAGDAGDRICSINDLMDYRIFRDRLEGGQRVAIMGAGLIGCEFANDLRNGGFDVDVIAPSSAVMPGLLPPEAAAAVQEALAAEGVAFYLDNHVKRADRDGGGVSLLLAGGERLSADLVISAVGLRARTEVAQAAGIRVNRGIVTDRYLQTSMDDVYALGDCAEVDGHVLMYVLPLMACARSLAKTLTGSDTQVTYGTMPVMVKTPVCPTAVCPPLSDSQGEWHEEREGHSVRSLFRAPDGQLRGFAVTGDYAVEKQTLSREVPPIHR